MLSFHYADSSEEIQFPSTELAKTKPDIPSTVTRDFQTDSSSKISDIVSNKFTETKHSATTGNIDYLSTSTPINTGKVRVTSITLRY